MELTKVSTLPQIQSEVVTQSPAVTDDHLGTVLWPVCTLTQFPKKGSCVSFQCVVFIIEYKNQLTLGLDGPVIFYK